jgi:PERQ amino acid-rich with GYF domain-containing protein
MADCPSYPYLQQSIDRARRANGATQTFRRPSHATTTSGSAPTAASRDASNLSNLHSSNPGVYVPPHAQSGRNGSAAEGRYSRPQLIQLFREQNDSEEIKDGLSHLFVGAWEPSITNGASSASWGRRDDTKEGPSGVDLCWDRDGSVLPLGLTDMTDEEREVSGADNDNCQAPGLMC